MAKRKVKILTDAEVAKAYEVTTGFNYPDGKGEKRVDAKSIVFEKDFEPEIWQKLQKLDVLKGV